MDRRPRPIRMIIARGLRKRCPQCGRGRLFRRWYTLHDNCHVCGLEFEPAEGDTWAFMYISTGFITGLIVIAMFVFPPPELWTGWAAVLVLTLGGIGATLPVRKGIAIALEYLVELRINRRSDLELRADDAGTTQPTNAQGSPQRRA